MRILPGFSLLTLVLAACATLTSVQSQQNDVGPTEETSPEWWGWEIMSERMAQQGSGRAGSSGTAAPTTASGECATGRRHCVNFHSSSMEALNRQVNIELSAFYSYTAMSSYFASTDGALRGCADLFGDQASEELGHANMFMEYIISRGGDLNLADVRTPNQTVFDNALHAMEYALEMEVRVTDALLELYRIAEEHGDASLADYLDSNFIQEQVSSMDEIAHYVAVLERFNGDPVGEYMFDETLYEDRRD